MEQRNLDEQEATQPQKMSYNAGSGVMVKSEPFDTPGEAGVELQQIQMMDGFIFGFVVIQDNTVFAVFDEDSVYIKSKQAAEAIITTELIYLTPAVYSDDNRVDVYEPIAPQSDTYHMYIHDARTVEMTHEQFHQGRQLIRQHADRRYALVSEDVGATLVVGDSDEELLRLHSCPFKLYSAEQARKAFLLDQ